MRVLGTIALAAALSTAQACGPRELPPQGQVLVYLDTNAPIRAATGPRDPVPLFDRVLVEIYAPGEASPCAECRREFAVDADKMRAGQHSFGFVPAPRVLGYRVRLVLFRSAGGLAARRQSAIELVGYLPAVAEDGITEITATFHVEDVGAPRGTLDAPVIFDKGAPAVSAEGTWPLATVTSCASPSPERAVCVPGGAFFMGDPRVTIEGTLLGGRRERIAVLPAFHLDAHEVTVGELRSANVAVVDSRGHATDPNDDTRDDLGGACDYTSAPGANEDLPVVCVSAAVAQRYCQARGGDLPTEAELEMVASRRGTALLPWGSGEPTCTEAVVARDILRSAGGCSDRDPLALGGRVLPERAGSGSIDRVTLEGGTIVDLGANVSEWTRDTFQTDDGTCWSSALAVAPRCDGGATAQYRSVKGGSLTGRHVDFAQVRSAVGTADKPANVGFRCVYPDRK